MTTHSSPRQRIVLLDAHAIIHRAYHAMPDFATATGVPTGAIFGFGTMVLKIIDEFKPDHIIACYDLPGKTFRHESFADYKGGRAETDTALKLQFDATREICEAFAIPIYDAPGFEADDILGTITEQMKKATDVDIIIASGDMDTLQLVDKKRVVVYTLKRGLNDTVIYDEAAVKERFGFKPLSIIDYKALRGDPSDNIPGIKGIGDKTATIAIQHFGTIEKMYKALEKDEESMKGIGLTPRMISLIKEGKEEAEFSKIIATIRTDAPIVFTMPKHSWQEAVDIEKASSIFEKYELRTLPAKLRSSLGQAPLIEEKIDYRHVSEEKIKEYAIKLWLLDSDKTDAGIDDILSYAQTKDFVVAQKKIDDDLAQEPNIQKVFDFIEGPLVSVIDKMQNTGVLVDVNFFKKVSQTYHQELDRLATKIHKLAGEEFNIKSPKQLSEILFEKMMLPTKGIKKSKSGSYSTNIDTLIKLKEVSPIVQHIVEYRELEKLLSTYLDVLPNLVGEDGRIHGEFVQNGTVTGRFSSRNPNLQNIPTRSDLGRKIREGFIAKKGHLLVSLDYSQIELRCLAILSGDTALIKIFNDGKDIHAAVASLIGGVPIDEVDREMRRKAKIVNFGILYGMGINSVKKEMNSDKAEAEKFYHGFFSQFPTATSFLEATKEGAREKAYTETLFGRRRQFKNIQSKLPFIRAMAERMALNAPIQGTSADMIKLGMIMIDNYLAESGQEEKASLILQIHDEIIYEVQENFVEAFSKQAQTILEQALKESYLNYDSPVPLVVHSSAGKNWGELK